HWIHPPRSVLSVDLFRSLANYFCDPTNAGVKVVDLPLLFGMDFLQQFNFAMLLQKLVQEHRVDLLITHGIDFAFFVAHHPIGIAKDSPATPEVPIQMLFEPVVRLFPPWLPIAILFEPEVMACPAPYPRNVFCPPELFAKPACTPTKVLLPEVAPVLF